MLAPDGERLDENQHIPAARAYQRFHLALPARPATPITLVSFSGADGANPFGSLIADAHGELFGTTI